MEANKNNSELDIGTNIRSTRLQKGLSIKELADLIEVSSSLLSQIERGLANPSISTMKSIADALDEPLYNFFLPKFQEDDALLSRAATRSHYAFPNNTSDIGQLPKRPAGYECERLSSKTLPTLTMLRLKLPPHTSNNPLPRQHEDLEVTYVESGTVKLLLGNNEYELYPQDSISIPPNTPHKWTNETENDVILIQSVAKQTSY